MNDLIDTLSDDLQPVRPLSLTRGRWLGLGAAAFSVLGFLLLFGLRPDLAAGRPAPLVLVIVGLFALSAVAAGWAATRLARPAVGSVNQTGALWLFAAILVLPAASAIERALGHGADMDVAFGLECLSLGLAASLVTAGALTAFLKRGAPVLPDKAGLLVGLSAGSVGALAITLECAGTQLSHLAVWHVGIVALWAALGRWGIGRMLRW